MDLSQAYTAPTCKIWAFGLGLVSMLVARLALILFPWTLETFCMQAISTYWTCLLVLVNMLGIKTFPVGVVVV